MPDTDRTETTRILVKAASGGREATDRLLPLVYGKLRELAAGYLRRERRNHTLHPTELVHEAYRKLVEHEDVDWRGRTHFLATGAKVMCQILVDHARQKKTHKRGGGLPLIRLSDVAAPEQELPLLDLLDALDELAHLNPRHHEVVVHRFFGGLGVDEVAEHLDVSTRTIERDTRVAIAWLRSRLS